VLPFLRWAGSKRLLLHELAAYWRPEYRRYIEPFAGSARLFFHLCPKKAVLGDINEDLMHTYEQLKKDPAPILSFLDRWPADPTTYYKVRAIEPCGLGAVGRAARFIYLNRYCFNGLYRTNLEGKFNVPFGGGKTGRIPDTTALRTCASVLTGAVLVPGDFQRVVARAAKGDFVYMDPPFSTASRRVFTEYDKSGFCPSDIKRLRAAVCSLANRGVSFLVSYVESPEAEYLAKGFDTKTVRVKRSIAGFTGAREHSPEVLISYVA
jgi:DNA adenine methylase